jgi:hypothetical protein
MDATLRELSDLIKEVKPAARGRMTRLSFALIYPDKRGRNVMRQVIPGRAQISVLDFCIHSLAMF